MGDDTFNEAVTVLGEGLILTLPSGVTEGRLDAAEWWIKICTEVRKHYITKYQFIPHTYTESGALESLLAIPI